MPHFLTAAELYRLLQRELPEDVYPDGAPSGFFSTADSDSVAAVLGTAYQNLSTIYDNYFVGTAEAKLPDWEIKQFGYNLDSALGVPERRARILARVREINQLDISRWTVITTLLQFLPVGTPIRIVEYGKIMAGGWQLGVSKLGMDTYLGFWEQPTDPPGGDYCATPADAEWLEARRLAYIFELRIFGYTLSAQERSDLNRELTRLELARAQHYIFDNLALSSPGNGLLTPVSPVSQFSPVDSGDMAIYVDTGSSTGYSAWSK